MTRASKAGTVKPEARHETAPVSSCDSSDRRRRRFLIAGTTVAATIAAGLMSWPLIQYLRPSAKARAVGGPIRLNVEPILPGQLVTVSWRGRPVWILRRTEEMLAHMDHDAWIATLRDPYSEVDTQQPEYARNRYRSIRPDLFVVVAICTHLGCVPAFHPDAVPERFDASWMGGYYCPCHGSRFDLAGRVVRNVPAPTNLVVPPHRYLDSSTLEIGVNPG